MSAEHGSWHKKCLIPNILLWSRKIKRPHGKVFLNLDFLIRSGNIPISQYIFFCTPELQPGYFGLINSWGISGHIISFVLWWRVLSATCMHFYLVDLSWAKTVGKISWGFGKNIVSKYWMPIQIQEAKSSITVVFQSNFDFTKSILDTVEKIAYLNQLSL